MNCLYCDTPIMRPNSRFCNKNHSNKWLYRTDKAYRRRQHSYQRIYTGSQNRAIEKHIRDIVQAMVLLETDSTVGQMQDEVVNA